VVLILNGDTMFISEERKIKIIEIALISAKNFSYYKSKNPSAGNFYVDENEIEGQCSDYALDFVIRWNKENPENEAEIVVINQDCGIQSGSYKVVKEIKEIPALIRGKCFKESGWLKNIPQENGGYIDLVLYHPGLGFYAVEQTKAYEVKTHFGEDMTKKGPHVWAKIEDIAIDPCWADTDNTDFIGEDIIN
jgi:hypothetical protein